MSETEVMAEFGRAASTATERLNELAREAQNAYDAYRRFIAAWVKEQEK